MPFYYFYDTRYLMMLIPVLLITLYAQFKVSSTFNRYSRIANSLLSRETSLD